MSLKRVFGILIAAALLPVLANAGEILLKKSGFGNWQYSTGDSNFVGAGSHCENLRREMSDDTAAVFELDKYNDQMDLSTVTLLGACGLAAFPIYKAAKSQWLSDYWILAGGAAGLVVASAMLQHSAAIHMGKAVDGYNQRKGFRNSPPTAFVFPTLIDRKTPGVGLAILF